MNTIGKKITIMTVIMIVISLLTVGMCSLVTSYSATMTMTEENLTNSSKVAAERVQWELTSYQNIVTDLGRMEVLSTSDTTLAEKQAVVDSYCEYYGFRRGNIIGLDGLGSDGTDYSGGDFFKNAINGENTITEPIVMEDTGTFSVIFAAPIVNTAENDAITGCVIMIPQQEFLNDIMKNVKMSDNSLAYIIDANGTTIADEDDQLVINQENCEELYAAGNEGYAETAQLHQLARQGEAGFYDYYENDVRYFSGYAPININGWSFIVWAPATDFVSSMYTSILTSIIIIVAAVVISILLSALLGSRIGKPIKVIANRIKLIADGDLTSQVPDIRAKDETGTLAESARFTVNGLNSIIGDIERILGEMANGNLAVDTSAGEQYYIGDYKQLLSYIKNINSKLSSTLSQINTASEQVAAGSDQVSSGAQALSQGTTEQAATIEELASTINVIAKRITEEAVSAEMACDKTNTAGEEMALANEKMSELVEAMKNISSSSDETKKIIKTIEDIAFQTNILALNAAVEAARAGSAGKGFAVVADEVRNLAGKSAEAAKNTTQLIEETVEAIESGNHLVEEVSNKMVLVSDAAAQVAQINTQVSEDSRSIASSVSEVTIGIDQISSVVQTNSATSEEAAAASEELSGQAMMLKELVGSFRLNESSENNY